MLLVMAVTVRTNCIAGELKNEMTKKVRRFNFGGRGQRMNE